MALDCLHVFLPDRVRGYLEQPDGASRGPDLPQCRRETRWYFHVGICYPRSVLHRLFSNAGRYQDGLRICSRQRAAILRLPGPGQPLYPHAGQFCLVCRFL